MKPRTLCARRARRGTSTALPSPLATVPITCCGVPAVDDVEINILDDYNPPEVDPFSAKEAHKQKSEEFEQDAAVSLDAFEEVPPTSHTHARTQAHAPHRHPLRARGQAKEEDSNSSSYGPIFSTNASLGMWKGTDIDRSWFQYKCARGPPPAPPHKIRAHGVNRGTRWGTTSRLAPPRPAGTSTSLVSTSRTCSGGSAGSSFNSRRAGLSTT